MSNRKLDQDGFEIIKTKRNSKNKQTKIPIKSIKLQKEDIEIDVEKVIQRIKAAVEELEVSNYFEAFSKPVSNFLQDREDIEIICFGLGHVAECNISRYQLALLLCLKNFCKVTKVFVHDPIFYKGECEVLRLFGLQVILENHEGGYITSDKLTTIAYFPHCPKQLTNNFLWTNWGIKLQNCLLICNSFNSLLENNPTRIIAESVPFIYKIQPHTIEVVLENNFKFTDIYNDTSLHYFPKDKIKELDLNFWVKSDKPTYENTEEFITSLMIEKLNI